MPTLQQLRQRVEGYLVDVPSVTAGLIDSWINKAVTEIERQHNFWHMEDKTEFVTAPGTRLLGAKPARWKQPREAPYLVRDDGSIKELAWGASGQDMRRQYDVADTDDDGEPVYVLEVADGFEVYPFPDDDSDYGDGNYRVHIPHWMKTAALVENSDTNWYTENAEWYLTFYAASEGLLLNRDVEEATMMLERSNIEKGNLITANKNTRKRQPRQLEMRLNVYGRGRRPPKTI